MPAVGAMSERKFIYTFEEGDGGDRMLLGGKGANLCAMTQIGLNVPPGFVITTAACLAYLDEQRLPDGLMDDVRAHIAELERKTGKGFGSATNPLLVSVRSGSAMSMPGMMDTILNLGLNPATLQGPDGPDGQPALRLGRVPALRPAVRQDRDGHSRRSLRRRDGGGQAQARRRARRRAGRRRARRSSRRRSSPSTASTPASRCPSIPTSSSSAPSRRCSGRGTASARSITGGSSGSRPRWPTAPRSTSARWSSATWATIRPPASASPAIRAPARTRSTASTW